MATVEMKKRKLDGLSPKPVTKQSFFVFEKSVFHLRFICG